LAQFWIGNGGSRVTNNLHRGSLRRKKAHRKGRHWFVGDKKNERHPASRTGASQPQIAWIKALLTDARET
jgi:hypothetical protein